MPFSIQIPVRFRDLDCMGHMNNAVYFSYMEQARVAFCAQFPEIDFRNPQNRIGKSLILASISCEFKIPVGMGQTIEVDITVPRIGNSSFDIAYELRLAGTKAVVATGKSVQVYYDYAVGKSLSLPDHLRKLLEVL